MTATTVTKVDVTVERLNGPVVRIKGCILGWVGEITERPEGRTWTSDRRPSPAVLAVVRQIAAAELRQDGEFARQVLMEAKCIVELVEQGTSANAIRSVLPLHIANLEALLERERERMR